jgi:lipopolysaccharide transport system ATP-binding protein
MSRNEIRGKFDEIVDFSGVERYIDTPVKRYSSGMYVRLAFAVAAHLEPEILILDEVLAVGDFEFQKKCLGKMKDVSQQGRTVLFVSHNTTSIKNLCSKVILLKNGMMIKEGQPDEVINCYLGESAKSKNKVHVFTEEASKEAQILKVQVVDNLGNCSNEFDMNSRFSLVVDYKVREKLTGISIGFALSQANESAALITSNESELDFDRLKTRVPGYYRSSVAIPEKLLNVGEYKFRVGLTAQKVIYDFVEDIYFELFDNVGIVQHLGYEKKNSILALQLPWSSIYSESPF